MRAAAQRRDYSDVARALGQHPNRLERRVLAALIDFFPEAGWQFNPGIVINRKIPDFVRMDGVSLAIDIHGDYWHRDDTPQMCRERKNLFLAEGWQLVIIWEREFRRDPTVLRKRVLRALRRLRECRRA